MRPSCSNALIACALIRCLLGSEAALAQGVREASRLGEAFRLWDARPPAEGSRLVGASLRTEGSRLADASPRAEGSRLADAPQLPEVDSCLSRLDPQLDIGYDRIAARCPELAKKLDHGSWAPWLPRGWKEPGNDLSAGGLKELLESVNRESAAVASQRAPDVGHLQVALNALTASSSEGWWARLKSWLRSILERRQQPTDESWFSQMVSKVGVPQSLRQAIAYAALAAVVLLAGAIVVNELRAAGVLPKRGALARKRRAVSDTRTREVQWRDIDRAPLADKPRLLLELIVRRLSDRGYLPPAGALTVRELTNVVRLPEPDDRTRLADVALAAERVRYAAREPQSSNLDESIARGRELLDRLDASAARSRELLNPVDTSAARGRDLLNPLDEGRPP